MTRTGLSFTHWRIKIHISITYNEFSLLLHTYLLHIMNLYFCYPRGTEELEEQGKGVGLGVSMGLSWVGVGVAQVLFFLLDTLI